MLHLLGIRHHGPGSAKAVLKALEKHPPDCLLIEVPADAEPLLKYLELPDHATSKNVEPPAADFIPPVAMLLYDPKDLNRASYLPFAGFSPEWQAIRFALKNNIPVRFMDLPMELHFGLDEAEKKSPQTSLEFFQKEKEAFTMEERQFRQDPMAYIAHLAGYSDSERWWEVMFEGADNEADIFQAIFGMITVLREGKQEEPRTLQREAYMRQCIRQAIKDGFVNITVVCGAWHVPALVDLEKTKASFDAALLKGIKKIKTTATWIPWSYDRLTFQSGYRSGIISPAWYELLFHEKQEAAMHWMIGLARLLREEDVDASSANVIEAIRLAETLAFLRGLAIPGIDELKEAAISTICEGDVEKLAFIENKLIVGNKVGSVPDKIPTMPLQRDIEQSVKTARLTKYWENTSEQWLGATSASPQGGIDLREEAGKMKSHLLHRLNLLNIPWGQLKELNRHQSAGSFKEFWKMKWSPDFSIRIIEMGAWGNTVEEACVRYLKKKTAETTALPVLTLLVKHTLNANLPDAFETLLVKLEYLAALSTDTYHLMDALPPLAQIIRYGNTRGTNIATVEKVVTHLVPRICIGLPLAIAHLDEDASKDAFDKLIAVNFSLGLLNNPEFLQQWHTTLKIIAENTYVNGILTGSCTRILFDKKVISENETGAKMSYALSRANAPLAAAQWLEGFLQGSGLLIVHNHLLWNLLDNWVSELGEEHFSDVLPLLRRTFSKFSQPERERMMDLAKKGQLETHLQEQADVEMERAAAVLPVVRALLGIG